MVCELPWHKRLISHSLTKALFRLLRLTSNMAARLYAQFSDVIASHTGPIHFSAAILTTPDTKMQIKIAVSR